MTIPLISHSYHIYIAFNPPTWNPLRKYQGTVKSVLDFGAFVDIGAESDGLLHISRISQDFPGISCQFPGIPRKMWDLLGLNEG
jgi:DNA-directed RNA polymerase subunit E'/Rpb7